MTTTTTVPELPADVVRAIVSRCAGDIVSDPSTLSKRALGGLRAACKLARDCCAEAYTAHLASGTFPSALRENLAALRRRFMFGAGVHPMHPLMVSIAKRVDGGAIAPTMLLEALDRLGKDLDATGAPAVTFLLEGGGREGRKKRPGWKPAVMQVSSSGQLRLMVGAGYTRGVNDVVASTTSKPLVGGHAGRRETRIRASMGSVMNRFAAQGDIVSHREALLVECEAIDPVTQTIREATILFPRIADVIGICATDPERDLACHAVARFALGPAVAGQLLDLEGAAAGSDR